MQVAVFGAGYAGLTLARRLEQSLPPEVDLVVVDEDDHHLVQHEIHRAVRRPAVADHLRIPLADVLDRAELLEARVESVDAAAGVATFEDGGTLAYDAGAVCLGAETAFYGLPGVEEHATPLKRLAHAAEIREDFLAAIEAGTPEDPADVVVGGAGLSGVQVAGELAALAREEDASEVVGITLLERLDAVAPNFPPRFQAAVREQLEARDVVVRTGAAVAEAGPASVELETGDSLPADQLVWTGGIRGPDALAGDRPVVRSDLRLEGDTFVVGDAARIVDADGGAVPASAQAAVRSGRQAADNLDRLVDHRLAGTDGFEPRLSNFRFDSPGWLVSVGDGAVAQVGSAVLSGPAAIALKTTVGAGYLSTVGAVSEAADLVTEELGMTFGSGVGHDGGDDEEEAASGDSDEESGDGAGNHDGDDGPIDVDVE